MIVLYTDFGPDDLYVAQVKAALIETLSRPEPILDLTHAVPAFDVAAGAHLLAALQARFPRGTVFFAVVDPGVGTERAPVVVQADGKWYVGPDNGLISVTAARAEEVRTWRIVWRPSALSVSFHGRDLFAPVAAWLANGAPPDERLETTPELGVRLPADDYPRVVYVDHYGNVLTGLRARSISESAALDVGQRRIEHSRVFADSPRGAVFWYENSIGLVEIAANRASAAALLGVRVGDTVDVLR